MVERGVGDALAAGGNAADIREAGHAAATIDFGLTQIVSFGILNSLVIVRLIHVKTVETPFIHVATHVVDAQFVGLSCTDRVSLIVTILLSPGHLFQIVGTTEHVMLGKVTTPSGIFPFRFRGKTVFLARQLV